MGKRLWQYPEVTNIDSDDFLLLDNESEGSKCIKANKIGAVLIDKTVTERKTYTASDDSVNGYKKVIVDVPYTDVHYEKDDIVSFTGEDFPLKSLTADITALQDLHGYDYPWVGGAGKNKLEVTATSKTEGGVTWTVNSDGTVTVSGTATAYTSLALGEAKVNSSMGNIIISGMEGTTNIAWGGIELRDSNNNVLLVIATGDTYSYFTVDLSQYPTAYKITMSVKRNNSGAVSGVIKPQVELGQAVTTYEPYSNICPISGWSAVDVSVSGVNVWDEEWELGGILNTTGQNTTNNSTIRTKNYIPVVPNTQYYINSSKWQFVSGYDADKNFVGTVFYVSSGTGYYINVPSNVHYIRIPFSTAYGTTYNNDISINYPSTDTTYHAYNGQTYTIQFKDGDNPLTVYGGSLDVVSGVLTVDRAYVDLGTLNWSYSSISERFYVGASDLGVKATDASTPFNAISSALIAKSYNEIEAKTVDYAIAINPNATQLFARYSSITSASDFITAMNGVQLVYELATPLTYQLSKQQIRSLVGENNIFADTGEVSVEWQTLYQTPSE